MGINRRQFVKSSLISSAALLTERALGQLPLQRVEDCDCLVIGAGMAGLTAARELSFPKHRHRGAE